MEITSGIRALRRASSEPPAALSLRFYGLDPALTNLGLGHILYGCHPQPVNGYARRNR
jgi:hypothetical protein